MSEKKKSTISSLLALLTLFATALFWTQTSLVTILLLGLGIAMMYVENEKSAVVIYLIGFIFGAFVEIFIINISPAWEYAEPHFWGIPFWLPFIWGNSALFMNRSNIFIRHKLSESRSNHE